MATAHHSPVTVEQILLDFGIFSLDVLEPNFDDGRSLAGGFEACFTIEFDVGLCGKGMMTSGDGGDVVEVHACGDEADVLMHELPDTIPHAYDNSRLEVPQGCSTPARRGGASAAPRVD